MTYKKARIGLVLVLALALSACSAFYRNHGYIPPAEEVDAIVVGIDTRDTVIETLGSPTVTGVLNESGVYYVQTRVRTWAWRKPEIIERQLLAIRFDNTGTVSNVERFGLEDGRVVVLERRVTDQSVNDLPFLRRLLGNIGGIAGFGR